MIGALRAFPSIVMWVTNNEGWGQYDVKTVGSTAKNMDPSRLVNNASGWFDVPGSGSDVYDIHTYDEVPVEPAPPADRPIVTGEFAGRSSQDGRVGKEWVRRCRTGWRAVNKKQ